VAGHQRRTLMNTEERKLRRSELYALVWEKAVKPMAA
jgi:hypothetical protein